MVIYNKLPSHLRQVITGSDTVYDRNLKYWDGMQPLCWQNEKQRGSIPKGAASPVHVRLLHL